MADRLRLAVVGSLVAIAVFAWVTASAGAAGRFPDTGWSPTGGIAEVIDSHTPEVFNNAILTHFDWNGVGQIVLSGNPDGTGSTLVDDSITIRVYHPDGSRAMYRHAYSPGCGALVQLNPVNITNRFAVGDNRVVVVLQDLCGGFEGANAMWITRA